MFIVECYEEETLTISPFSADFRKRFISLLSYKFREFASVTALSVLEAANAGDIAEVGRSAF
jgi:N-acetyltransferase 10